EIACGAFVEIMFFDKTTDGVSGLRLSNLANQSADLRSERHGALGGICAPERHLSRLSRRRRHEHAIVGDLLDAPGGSAEENCFADARFEDHLLIELADARAAFFRAGQEDAVESAIGNPSAAGDLDAIR